VVAVLCGDINPRLSDHGRNGGRTGRHASPDHLCASQSRGLPRKTRRAIFPAASACCKGVRHHSDRLHKGTPQKVAAAFGEVVRRRRHCLGFSSQSSHRAAPYEYLRTPRAVEWQALSLGWRYFCGAHAA